ncbi:hypothetical protein PROFUN_08469 [Planoprotostelium fungivorum]|uniref:Uncharacterized protein n=1 Tax=Planoprotostelium fungivorum TaxID=1890364 RepID=A0A2P6N1W7_9EUKA|nr:hypothetical protein PROFUN_08469 [Planoprotostelium fungivorum]
MKFSNGRDISIEQVLSKTNGALWSYKSGLRSDDSLRCRGGHATIGNTILKQRAVDILYSYEAVPPMKTFTDEPESIASAAVLVTIF